MSVYYEGSHILQALINKINSRGATNVNQHT